jgi:hypothetical protein
LKLGADEAELKLEQLVDERDMALSMQGDVEMAEGGGIRRTEILALADVRRTPLPSPMPCHTAHEAQSMPDIYFQR